MKTTPKSEATDLAIFEPPNAVAVLSDREQFNAFYARIRAEVDAHTPDLTTESGRKAIASLAYKVARTKTAIDDAGKLLTEEWRGKINVVDASRREIRDRLDTLKAEVRAPLTEWEAREEKRIATVDDQIKQLRAHCTVLADETAEIVAARLANVANASFERDLFQGHLQIAENLKLQCVEILEAALARLRREEADRLELDRLRQAEADRIERERVAEEARIQAERAEQEATKKAAQSEQYARAIIDHIKHCGLGFIDGQTYPYIILIRELEEKITIDDSFGALEAEARAVLAENLKTLKDAFARDMEDSRRRNEEREKAELARATDEARAAAEAASARKAEEARIAQQKAHDEALAAEKKRADDAEADRKAEAAKQAQIEADRVAEAKRIADEQAAREKDRKHRGEVMRAAKEAIMNTADVDEPSAKRIVTAIVANEIPSVTLRF